MAVDILLITTQIEMTVYQTHFHSCQKFKALSKQVDLLVVMVSGIFALRVILMTCKAGTPA